MNRVCIVSELSLKTVNFGNVLQAYALNSYIRNSIKFDCYSITDSRDLQLLNPNSIVKEVKQFLSKVIYHNTLCSTAKARNKRFREFILSNIQTDEKNNSIRRLKQSSYDYFVVGSDVVWSQTPNVIDRMKFFDFKTDKPKYAYAASFGNNIIPPQNKATLKRLLDDYKFVSVREIRAKKMLEEMGVHNVKVCVDPTMLIDSIEWGKLFEKPKTNIPSEYIFTYFLGKDSCEREIAIKLSKDIHLPIVTVPFANGESNYVDSEYGDYKIDLCSPGEWLYLIKNAKYVITDSFHGLVFSAMFKTPFLGIARSGNSNERLINFCQMINESNKMIEKNKRYCLQEMEWDFEDIHNRIRILSDESKQYLKELFRC